jgi:putative acetyltransferase
MRSTLEGPMPFSLVRHVRDLVAARAIAVSDIASITVREFRPDDVDSLIALFRATVRSIARRDYTQQQLMAWAPDDIDRGVWMTRCAGRHTFVAEIDAAVVGFAELERSGYLDLLYVHANWQGRGIASALLAHTESVARREGAACLHSCVSITARGFFEHRGFFVTASQLVSLRGQKFTNYRMVKSL